MTGTKRGKRVEAEEKAVVEVPAVEAMEVEEPVAEEALPETPKTLHELLAKEREERLAAAKAAEELDKKLKGD